MNAVTQHSTLMPTYNGLTVTHTNTQDIMQKWQPWSTQPVLFQSREPIAWTNQQNIMPVSQYVQVTRSCPMR